MTRKELLDLLVPREDSECAWEGLSGPVRFYLESTNGYYHMKVYLGRLIFFCAGPRTELDDILDDTLLIIEGDGPTHYVSPGELRDVADWLEQNLPPGPPSKSAFERL